jgi:hypothetical protein
LSRNWKQGARWDLLNLRGRSGGWGYRRGQAPCVEPTVLACLGLLASEDPDEDRNCGACAFDASHQAAAWMAAIQREDGSVPVSQNLPAPGWATPYAILLWSCLTGFEAARRRACNWLLGLEGRAMSNTDDTQKVVGHDTTLIGWPWVEGTHSWLEPTAMAILALSRMGLGDHPRVGQGIGLILDRAIPDGGWNYGNKAVFGRALRPLPGPTGLALLVLAARGDRSAGVVSALGYLRKTLPNLRAAVSLGWGVLAARAYHVCPVEADTWLEEAYVRCKGRSDTTLGLALLTLAAGEGALRLTLPPSAMAGGGVLNPTTSAKRSCRSSLRPPR